jgi:hypothetical protein
MEGWLTHTSTNQGMPQSPEAGGKNLLRASDGAQSCQQLEFGLLTSRTTRREWISVVLNHQVWSNLLQQPQETNIGLLGIKLLYILLCLSMHINAHPHPRMESLGHGLSICLALRYITKRFSKETVPIYTPTSVWEIQFFHVCVNLRYVSLLYFALLVTMQWF